MRWNRDLTRDDIVRVTGVCVWSTFLAQWRTNRSMHWSSTRDNVRPREKKRSNGWISSRLTEENRRSRGKEMDKSWSEEIDVDIRDFQWNREWLEEEIEDHSEINANHFCCVHGQEEDPTSFRNTRRIDRRIRWISSSTLLPNDSNRSHWIHLNEFCSNQSESERCRSNDDDASFPTEFDSKDPTISHRSDWRKSSSDTLIRSLNWRSSRLMRTEQESLSSPLSFSSKRKQLLYQRCCSRSGHSETVKQNIERHSAEQSSHGMLRMLCLFIIWFDLIRNGIALNGPFVRPIKFVQWWLLMHRSQSQCF